MYTEPVNDMLQHGGCRIEPDVSANLRGPFGPMRSQIIHNSLCECLDNQLEPCYSFTLRAINGHRPNDRHADSILQKDSKEKSLQ